MRIELAPQPAPIPAPSEAGMASHGAPVAQDPLANDFWDVNHSEPTDAHFPVDYGFDDAIAPARQAPAAGRLSRVIWYTLFSAILAGVALFAYDAVVSEHDPLVEVKGLVNFVRSLMGVEADNPPDSNVASQSPDKPSRKKKPHHPKPESNTPPREPEKPGSVVAGNPYWTLPNQLCGNTTQLNRHWTPEEEETWRASLTHKFSYQRFKAVQDVRQRQLRGSEAIFWQALSDKKFWTRAYAAVGIAEFNLELPLQAVDAVLGLERSELIANFLERFANRPNAGQAYFLRQLVRLLDERGRLVALRGIANAPDDLRELYLTAASRDPGERVQAWITAYRHAHPLTPHRTNELLAVVEGQRDGSYLIKEKGPAQPSGKSSNTPPLRLATDDDLDKELADFGDSDGGAVELYDLDHNSDKIDPETFEYDDAIGTKPKQDQLNQGKTLPAKAHRDSRPKR